MNNRTDLGVLMHTWNSSIQKVEAGEWHIQGQPGPDLKEKFPLTEPYMVL